VQTIASDTPLRAVLKQIREVRSVSFLLDQDMPQFHGVFVPFFGREAYTATSAMTVARMLDANVYIGALVRHGRKYHLITPVQIQVPKTDDKSKDVYDATAMWTSAFEGMIRQYPEQWMWMHRRWRTKRKDIQELRIEN